MSAGKRTDSVPHLAPRTRSRSPGDRTMSAGERADSVPYLSPRTRSRSPGDRTMSAGKRTDSVPRLGPRNRSRSPEDRTMSAVKWTGNVSHLSPRTRTALRRAQLSVEEVLALSPVVLQRNTGLGHRDVETLRSAARSGSSPKQALCLAEVPVLSSGSELVDRLLGGGLPVGSVTELFGPSAVGKTQLALQLCLSVQLPRQHGGLQSGAVFVSTEDRFPSQRLLQMVTEFSLRPDLPQSLLQNLSDGVFVEHAADLTSLLFCLQKRVSLLLSRGLVRLLVVDSVAALFRSDFKASDWLKRHQQLLAVSSELQRISRQHQTVVLCINQVVDLLDTDKDLAFGPACSSFGPALGLAWSNQLTLRLMMRREEGLLTRGDQSSAPRSLRVTFAPHLPSAVDQSEASVTVGVWREGLG